MLKRYVHTLFALLGISCGGSGDGSGSEGEPSGISQALRLARPPSVGAWFFLPVEGMTCADGSATGLGMNLANRPSGKLLIYLEGGGGCWDERTCHDPTHVQNANLNGFDATTFQEVMVTGSSRYSPPIAPNYGAQGLWDRTSATNPFARYDFVYIPYCTADFHEGNSPHSPTDGLSHVGYVNMTRALTYLSQIFSPSAVSKVVLIGSSAGGFGALWNLPQAQAAFGSIPVMVIEESAPPLPAPYLAPSLEEAWRTAWGLDGAKPAVVPTTHLFPYLQWLAQAYPSSKLGFVATTGDVTLASFLGMSLIGPNSLSNGLFTLRQQAQETAPSLGFFFIPSLTHGYIHSDPATWPAPSPPFGNNRMSLSSWINLELE